MFETGKTELSAEANTAVQAVAEHLKAVEGAAVQLSGFTDTSGDPAANAELAKNRAIAVRDALVAAGVAEARIVLQKPDAVAQAGNPDEARAVRMSLAAAPAAAEAPAAEAAAAPAEAAADAPKLDSGDTAWMLTSTMLVILMVIPGLALFYGGLGRSKNMLSVLLQVFMIFSAITLLWVIYGYSLAFSGEGKFFGDFSKVFLKGIAPDTLSHMLATIPEYVFVSFQSTFAAITVALIVGAFAERMRFSAVMIFSVLWFTFSYVPMAHMVWGGGILAADGALDFAGGTVVHINAGMAALVGAYMVGKRIGFGREAMAPHSLTLTMVGASLLWVGWFGFNAGSAGAANGGAGLAFVNTIVATGAAAISWVAGESLLKGKASMLGAVSGAVGGLVVITPAAGFVGPMGAIVMGLIGGVACLWGVNGLKRMLKVDDAFDVFGVHGVGGIVGAVLTGVFASQALGGTGGLTPDTFNMGKQVWIQIVSVVVTMVWSGIVAYIAFKIADVAVGLRVSEEAEREGLDISSHGETAYAR
ncbi:ammonia channel protein [Comamonas serinivorans]|uniref:Ammonium transporter n=1 Tax=Comamonas serinivorans TaxID=1082851 RepID=A0A1Y0ESP3_9BURK|nr:ammonia channel protein [Comamonas serinivorans]